VILVMATISAACSLTFGWLIGMSLALVVGVGLLYGFAALGDSPIYSTAITEAWGWAFVSLGIAGLGAVVSVVLFHRTPEASALHRGSDLRASAISEAAR
jgi:hypothetical protein